MQACEPPSDERAVAALLVNAGRAITQAFNEALAASGLRMRQVNALLALSTGSLSQQALARNLHIGPTKLVGLLNEMEADGLVARERDQADRRQHIVTITTRGAKRLAATMSAVEDFHRALVAGLTDRQVGQVRAALTVIGANLDASADCSP